MNQPSDETIKKILSYFLKTSVPRIIEERKRKSEKAS